MIIIKSAAEIDIMRQCGRILADILDKLREETKEGVNTRSLDIIMEEETRKRSVIPSFKDYHGYPSNLCVSINNEIVHGIPGERIIEEGDIVSLDAGVIFKGFHTDSAITVGVGKITKQARELIEVTEAGLEAGIAQARCGGYIRDISAAVQNYVERRGYSVVREYTGHGIGRNLHEEPQVPNFAYEGGPRLRKGMVLAIEPMVNVGDWHTKVSEDNWKVLTSDGSLSAHFEHTIAIKEEGAEVLTCS